MSVSRTQSAQLARILFAAASLSLLTLGVSACEGTASVDGMGMDDQTTAPTGPVDPDPIAEDKTLEDLSTDELALVELKRDAIDRGLSLGKVALADELNIVLGDVEITTRYQPTVVTTDGEVYLEPKPVGVCPFLEPDTGTGTATTSDCRTVADRAIVAAYSNLSTLQTRNPLDTSFDRNRDENEYWYEQGMMTGMDNETAFAVDTLRTLGACDQEPTPEQSAFEEGVERGRDLYIAELNERLAETGQGGSYPDNIVQIQVCQADRTFLEPARSRASENVQTFTENNALCADFDPSNVDETNRLNEARNRYEDGVQRGIDVEHNLAGEKMFRVVPCNVGDPIVLDIAGDGIDVTPVYRSETNFDLFATGERLRTAWISGDDALLVLDRDGNGTIDDGRELFANFVGETGYDEVETGFAHLALHDHNRDGRIDANDPVFAQLRLWQDADASGTSDAGELHDLDALGVASIALQPKRIAHADSQVTHRAVFLRTFAGFKKTGSLQGDAYDVWFQFGKAPLDAR